MLTNLKHWLQSIISRKKIIAPKAIPRIYTRSEHNLSRRDINKYALKVLYRLHESGFQAYLVGGGVRDVLLNRHPKDFDIVTDAHPEQISQLFRNSRLIGRRFRLVHVHFSGHIVEVATFRAQHPSDEDIDPSLAHSHEDGMIIRDNIYGSFEEDVWRRDFTVNALYYNIADFSIIDYVNGMEDLKKRALRMIGEPFARYREDPVRMLRAVRLAAKLDFTIEEHTQQPIFELGKLLANVPGARLFDEYLKLFLSGYAYKSYTLLRQYKLFGILFPQSEESLIDSHCAKETETFLIHALKNTDKRVAENKPVAPPFLLAALLWQPMILLCQKLVLSENVSEHFAFFQASHQILHEQCTSFAIPRRLTHAVKEIWTLQLRLKKRSLHRAKEVFCHPRFRAAYDFLLLRAQSGERQCQTLAQWWTEYIDSDEEKRKEMASTVKDTGHKRRKRKRSNPKPLAQE